MAPASSKSSRKQEYSQLPFLFSAEETAKETETNVETGLSLQNAQKLQEEYGENMLEGQGGVMWYTVLSKQTSNAMILVSFRKISELSIQWNANGCF